MKINFYPYKDASIYNLKDSLNSGLDQILELEHTTNNDDDKKSISRILLHFGNNINSISESISNGTITNPTFSLKLFSDEVNHIPLDYMVECHAISGSWNMGTGKRFDNKIISNGVSWKYRDSIDGKTQWLTSSYAIGSTGSNIENGGGGNWYTSSMYRATQSFSYQTTDLNIDVTPIVNSWINNDIPNDGFILKRTDNDESNQSEQGILQFFSLETNTVFVPVLQCSYADSSFNTASISEINSDDIVLNAKLDRIYKQNEISKVYVNVRDRFPTRSFTTQSNYSIKYHLPTSSYYSIKDSISDFVIFDYDDNTQLSIDENGSYFHLNTNSLFVNRYYNLTFKVVTDGGKKVEYFDNNNLFKITR